MGELPPHHGERLLVDLEHLRGDARPCEALRALAGGGRHPRAPGRIERQNAQRLRELPRVAARGEQTVDAVAHDVAVAGDVRRHHRRARGERLSEHHPEALAAERGSAEHVGAAQLFGLLVLGDLAQCTHPAVVEQQWGNLLRRRPHQRERGGHVLAQRLEGAQQHRQPLALDGLADEQDAQWGRLPIAIPLPTTGQTAQIGLRPEPEAGRVELHPVGHDPVAPTEEAPRGPSRGLGDRDPRVQAVDVPARPERHPDPVGEGVLGEAVEGAHHREAARAVGGIPADERHDGLVHVDEVVAAGLQLPPQREHRVNGRRQVGDGPVGREPRGAPERHDPVGQRHRLRAGTAVHPARKRVVGVEGRKDTGLVTDRLQLVGERLDVAGDAARIGPRVGRDECDPHAPTLTPPPPASPRGRLVHLGYGCHAPAAGRGGHGALPSHEVQAGDR